MTDKVIESMTINKILIGILEEHNTISVPADKFIDLSNTDKELVVEYDDKNKSFKFSLRRKNG